jgi:hypothetical protein
MVIPYTLYDTIIIPAFSSFHPIHAFIEPLSKDKTHKSTNTHLANRLPAPEIFLVEGINIDYDPLLEGTYELRIGSKIAVQRSLVDIHFVDSIKKELGFVILSQQNFEFVIIPEINLIHPTTVKVELIGLLAMPIQ